jgi:hypothetical protein
MGKKSIHIQTQLGISECITKIRENDMGEFFSIPGDPVFRGDIRGNKIILSKVTQIPNIVRPYFHGNIQETNEKTEITGDFSMKLPVKIFFIVFLGTGSLITLVAWWAIFVISYIDKSLSTGYTIVYVIFPIVWLSIVASPLIIGRWLSRNDKKEIKEHLAKLFDAGID